MSDKADKFIFYYAAGAIGEHVYRENTSSVTLCEL